MKIIPMKRRRQAKTNYLRRKRLLEGGNPRIVIRKTNKYIILQYVETKIAQDNVKVTISSRELLKNGWPKDKEGSLKNLAAAYLTGLLFGKKIAEEKGEAIVDFGLIRSTKGSRVYAALKGIVDSGAKVAHNKEMFPEQEKIEEKNKEIFAEVKSKIGGNK
jgi:large subunit ribosomal protein L18